MTHDELRDSYELYALGVADPAEREEIRAHLDRGCEVCIAEVNRARTIAAFLGDAAPSPELRRRILASVGFEQRRFGWAPFLAAALLLALFAAFYFSGREREFANLALRRDLQLRAQAIQLTRFNEAFAILNSGETAVKSFAKGRVFVNPTRGVLLIASNLPQAPTGKAYEMWVVPKGGRAPVAAGLFQPDANGNVLHIQREAVDVRDVAAVGVSLENESGASTPTTPFVVEAPLG